MTASFLEIVRSEKEILTEIIGKEKNYGDIIALIFFKKFIC